ncbi:hypothetical protein CWB81_11315, partial [Pseudoalteromonas sp. S1688]
EVTHLCMPLNMVSMAIYVTLEGKIPRTPVWERPRERTVAQRYPRLLAALRRNCLLTELEAWCALSRQEPEAVRHLGGWQKAIQAAWESRHRY